MTDSHTTSFALSDPESLEHIESDFVAAGGSAEDFPAFLETLGLTADSATVEEVLEEICSYIEKYVVFTKPEQLEAVALWVLHTWVFDQFDATPYLAVTAPEKESGKTRLFEVLSLLCRRPWMCTQPSEAVIYRKIENERPTLFLDETDAIFGDKSVPRYEALRALLNAGYRRGVTVPRCVGEGTNMKVYDFDVYCPKALAGIGELPDTVASRSIPIRLARRKPGQTTSRFHQKQAEKESAPLKTKIEAAAASLNIACSDPELPDALSDRAQDNWEPLLAIADAAGGSWPTRAWNAALVLSGSATSRQDSPGVQLLKELRSIFDGTGESRMQSSELVERLVTLEDAPWAEYKSQRPMTPQQLATLLKPYEISPKDMRFGERIKKGYERDQFEDAWERYVPDASNSASEGQHPQHPADSTENKGQQNLCAGNDVAPQIPLECRDVAPVAANSPSEREDETYNPDCFSAYTEADEMASLELLGPDPWPVDEDAVVMAPSHGPLRYIWDLNPKAENSTPSPSSRGDMPHGLDDNHDHDQSVDTDFFALCG